MMSAAALAMASVTGCSSQNGGEKTAGRWKMQVEVKMGLLLTRGKGDHYVVSGK